MKFKDLFKPKKEFSNKTKGNFLAAFDGRFNTHATPRFALALKIMVVVVAVVAITGGASVYADTTNVPTTNPLYPLKRLGESVQLALTPAQDKPQLQVDFAARRKQEIDALQATNPTSTLLPSLTNDLHVDIDDSVTGAEHTNLQDGKLKNFCDQLLSVVPVASGTAHNGIAARPRILDQFAVRCAQSEGNGGDSSSTVIGAATSSISTASSTIVATTTVTVSSAITIPLILGTSTPTSTRRDGGGHLRTY